MLEAPVERARVCVSWQRIQPHDEKTHELMEKAGKLPFFVALKSAPAAEEKAEEHIKPKQCACVLRHPSLWQSKKTLKKRKSKTHFNKRVPSLVIMSDTHVPHDRSFFGSLCV